MEEVLYIKDFMKRKDLKSVIFITEAPHSRRLKIFWDMFVEKGNPLIDFIGFLNYVMAYSINNIEEFRSNFENKGKAKEIIQLIKHKMKIHFNADFDFIILLRYINLWLVSYKIKDKETNNFLTYIKYLEILSGKQGNEF